LLITRTRRRRRGKNKKQSAPTLEPSGPSGATHFASLSHIPDSPTFRRAVPHTHLLHLRHLLTTQGPASASQRWQCKLTDSHETRKDTTVLHSIWQSGLPLKERKKRKEEGDLESWHGCHSLGIGRTHGRRMRRYATAYNLSFPSRSLVLPFYRRIPNPKPISIPDPKPNPAHTTG